MTKEKWCWVSLIFLMLVVCIIFIKNRFIQLPQTFGPIPSSSFGRNIPFSDIDIKFSCQPTEFYFSEDSDLSCKFLAKAKEGSGYNIEITAKIYSIENNQTFWICTSSISDIGKYEKEEYCKDSTGKIYFELPKGDYKISASKFTTFGNGVIATVETAKEVIFRGTLHIMSSYERENKQTEDGISLANIFITFIFIIPTAIIEIRRFLYENKNIPE